MIHLGSFLWLNVSVLLSRIWRLPGLQSCVTNIECMVVGGAIVMVVLHDVDCSSVNKLIKFELLTRSGVWLFAFIIVFQTDVITDDGDVHKFDVVMVFVVVAVASKVVLIEVDSVFCWCSCDLCSISKWRECTNATIVTSIASFQIEFKHCRRHQHHHLNRIV